MYIFTIHVKEGERCIGCVSDAKRTRNDLLGCAGRSILEQRASRCTPGLIPHMDLAPLGVGCPTGSPVLSAGGPLRAGGRVDVDREVIQITGHQHPLPAFNVILLKHSTAYSSFVRSGTDRGVAREGGGT